MVIYVNNKFLLLCNASFYHLAERSFILANLSDE